MCSLIGKGEKLERKINDLTEDLEDKIKENEYKTEDRIKEIQTNFDQKQAENDEKFEQIKQSLDENKKFIQSIEERFDKAFEQQQRIIEDILEKLAEVDFNRQGRDLLTLRSHHLFRRNNLIFNGLPTESGESQEKLYKRIRDIIKSKFFFETKCRPLNILQMN